MDEQPTLAPRGWYPDPGGTPAWRWWDGARWTDDVHPYGPSTRIVPDAQLEAEALAARRLVRVGVPLVFIAIALGAVLHVFEVSYLSASWHWFSSAMSRASHGGTTTLPTPPAQPSVVSTLTSLIILPGEVVALVLILIFQHRAATVAKALALDATLSPTFGVVGWFIPGADLVLPLLAFWGLLPKDHPSRRLMSICWIGYLVSGLATVLAFPLAATSSTAVGLCSAVSVVAIGISVRVAPAIIEAVIETHRALAGVGPADGRVEPPSI